MDWSDVRGATARPRKPRGRGGRADDRDGAPPPPPDAGGRCRRPLARLCRPEGDGLVRGRQERYGYGLFSVVDKAAGRLVDDCGLERLDADGAPETELGYDLRSDYWGRGLATEAAAALRDHAIRALDLPRVISLIRQGNAASQRVAEKIGMRHAADVTRHGRDYWLYALERDRAPQPIP